MTDEEALVLLHHWRVLAEHDAGYVLGRCTVCGTEDLLDLESTPQLVASGRCLT